MGQNITQADNPAGVRNLRLQASIEPYQAAPRFAQDFEFALEYELQGTISQQLVEGPALAKGIEFGDNTSISRRCF